MKWFKHDSTASLDAKLARVRLKYGMEGYGLYWFCLEAIARNVETHNLTFELEEDAELLSVATNIHYERVQEMMTYMVNLGLFENCDGRITCLKMATRTDEYTQKLLRNTNSVPTISGQCPDKVPPIRIEEKRIEQKRKDKNTKPVAAAAAPELNTQAWGIWLSHLKAKRKAPPATTVAKQQAFLAGYDKPTQASIIDQSILNNWQGLFPPKESGNAKNTSVPTWKRIDERGISGAERTRRAREAARQRELAGQQSDLGRVGEPEGCLPH